MSFWNANSDRDWENEINGPYPDRVERTCAVCGDLFTMEDSGEYVMHPACDRCLQAQHERNRQAKAEQEHEKPIKRGAA